MYKFYIIPHKVFNSHNNPINFIFVTKRLVALIKKKRGSWLYFYYDFPNNVLNKNADFVSQLISSKGVVLYTKR